MILVLFFGLGIDYIIMGLVFSFGWLFFGCLIVGVMGVSFIMVNVYIVDVSMVEMCVCNFGFVGVVFGFGFIIGFVLGGVLGGIDLWLLFFVFVVFCLMNWFYGFFILFELFVLENCSFFIFLKLNFFVSIVYFGKYFIVVSFVGVFVCIGFV